jgi:hypothetical protein
MGMFPRKEGRIQVLAGLAPFKPKSRILIENPLAGKASQKRVNSETYIIFTESDMYIC